MTVDSISPRFEPLWLAGRGEWEQAHEIAKSEESREGAWVHAYLHRAEGEKSNAGYASSADPFREPIVSASSSECSRRRVNASSLS